MNQARDEKAEEYIRSADPNEIADMPVTTCEYAFKDGWDAALEFLRGKEEAWGFLTDDYAEVEKSYAQSRSKYRGGENNQYARFDFEKGAQFQYSRDCIIISALKERIRELEEGIFNNV